MSDNLQPLYTPIKRRSFFTYAGATALVLAGCSKDSDPTTSTPGTISLGAGDVGVLNYAYALEQLEAAFYAQVVKTPAADFLAGELAYFTQIAAHEAIHRDFLKAAITKEKVGSLLQDLTPIFTTINFSSRNSVLTAAKLFEDLGVAAYNGAGILLKSQAYLTVAGQIASVEARHAALVRDLLTPGSFAADDQIDANGLDKQMTPTDVIAAAQSFITQQLDASLVGK
ncbi:ferritin-like domain-containing protein [Hymenobacter monticola]|uniref:Ferritin-like domain-containing protein n=1 Tax=Hymenobacter monticola TaxID=1705399 RepID=A0ABY4B6K1_9BACT|nr:ferritin-like domain-containing protein [Hymenobacter monticola]UOE34791.1 ferritin-like domain-containing protein [Hymenobacter monticola]